MKIMTIIGTRPEIIRLSIIIEKLDKVSKQILVHTGQNYDKNLNDIFMSELNVRKPDYYLNAKGSFGEQIATIMKKTEEIMLKEKPDKFLVLGDTNSSLAGIMAKRLHIPVYHMEAGNRSYSDMVPEEINRRLIDHSSDLLLPYTRRSKKALLREGISEKRIIITGNPILEVIEKNKRQIDKSKILQNFGLNKKNYFLITMHREENVDIKERLLEYVKAINKIVKIYKLPVVISLHPRTRKKMKEFNFSFDKGVIVTPPLGFFDFIKLELNAKCILTDSGTVLEEACIFKIPNLIIRDVTERPETLDVKSTFITGANTEKILNLVEKVLKRKPNWSPPPEYLVKDVSERILDILLERKTPNVNWS